MRLFYCLSVTLGAILVFAGAGVELGPVGGFGLGILGFAAGTGLDALVTIARRR